VVDEEVESEDSRVVSGLNQTQIERFTGTDARCRGLELPEGVLLRYNLSRSLFFYLKTAVSEGKIGTTIFASDSPYERQKTLLGEVFTPMFTPLADATHLDRVEELLYAWVDFVKEDTEPGREFKTFQMNTKRG
jgi:hypothetical protein